MKIPKISTLIIVTVIMTAVVHVVLSRSLDDAKQVSIYVLLLYMLLMFFQLIPVPRNHSYKVPRDFSTFVFIFLIAFVGVTSIYSLAVSTLDIFIWIKVLALAQYPTEFLTGAFSLIIGFTLFRIRLKYRLIFGLSEIAVGLLVSEHQVSNYLVDGKSLLEPNLYLAILTAGIYLIVRGFDNAYQGLYFEPIDQFISLWRKRN